ncbi:MAG: hypothetical protein AAFR61_30050 [Bacteroidota bacterium]
MRWNLFLACFLMASSLTLASQPEKSPPQYPRIHFSTHPTTSPSRIKVPDRLQLLYTQQGQMVVEVWDRKNQLWMKRKTEAQQGEMMLPFKRLPAGMYTVKVSDGSQAQSWTILHEAAPDE